MTIDHVWHLHQSFVDVEDLEEAPDNEVEAAEEQILDQATAARTIAELRAEIETLKQLEGLALAVCRSGTDRKWRELANLLSPMMPWTPAVFSAFARTWSVRRPGDFSPTISSPFFWKRSRASGVRCDSVRRAASR
jgi:hypothetical protein